MIIEQNTNYAYKLKYTDNPTFDKVRDLSTKFFRELPHALQDELHDALNRGIDILDSEPQMTAYMFSFGKMHQAKLEYAFGKLPEEFFEQPEINPNLSREQKDYEIVMREYWFNALKASMEL